MKKIKMNMNKSLLEAYMDTTPPIGTEIVCVNDCRYRAWVRVHGLSLGYQVYHKGHCFRKVVCRFGDVPFGQYRAIAKEMISKIQLSSFSLLPSNCPTVGDYYNSAFLAFSRVNHKNQRSITSSWNRVPSFMKRQRISDVSRTDILNVQSGLQSLGYASGTTNRTTALLSKLFNLAILDSLIEVNPVSLVQSLNEVFVPSVVIESVVLKHYVALSLASDNVISSCALGLAAVTGARIGEIVAIRKADVSSSSFLIRDTKNGDNRSVPFGSTGALFINKALSHSGNAFLFSSSHSGCSGHIGNPRCAHKEIINALMRKGLITTPFRIKDLRSTLATRLFEQTNNIEAVRHQLGHKTLSVTSKRYLHASEGHYQAMINSVEHLFNQGVSNEIN